MKCPRNRILFALISGVLLTIVGAGPEAAEEPNFRDQMKSIERAIRMGQTFHPAMLRHREGLPTFAVSLEVPEWIKRDRKMAVIYRQRQLVLRMEAAFESHVLLSEERYLFADLEAKKRLREKRSPPTKEGSFTYPKVDRERMWPSWSWEGALLQGKPAAFARARRTDRGDHPCVDARGLPICFELDSQDLDRVTAALEYDYSGTGEWEEESNGLIRGALLLAQETRDFDQDIFRGLGDRDMIIFTSMLVFNIPDKERIALKEALISEFSANSYNSLLPFVYKLFHHTFFQLGPNERRELEDEMVTVIEKNISSMPPESHPPFTQAIHEWLEPHLR